MCDFIFRLVEEMSNSDGNTNSAPCSRVSVNIEGRHSRPAVSKTTLKVCIIKTLACQGCIGCKTDLMAWYCGLYQKEHCDHRKIARLMISECHVECCVLVLPWPKKRPLRLCIKSEHCSYHAISAWSGDWHGGAASRDFAHRCTPKRNQAWFTVFWFYA